MQNILVSLIKLVFGDGVLNDIEIVDKSHTEEFYLPQERIHNSILRILSTALILGLVQLSLYLIIELGSSNDNENDKKSLKKGKGGNKVTMSYQLTNMLMNLYVGTYGIYYYIYIHPSVNELTITDRIEGFRDLTFFATSQFGYQLWAIPVGLFLVNESKVMLIHHASTILVSFPCSFCNNGFRFYNVYFFGVIEITTVPLAITNMLRDNQELRNRYPSLFTFFKLTFAFLFLPLRVIMWCPLMYDFLRHMSLFTLTSDSNFEICLCNSFLWSGVILTALQLYWGCLVVKGLVKVLIGSDGKSKKN